MTDFADEASERTEAKIAAALSNRMPEGPVATGYCLQCDAPLAAQGHCPDSPWVPDGRRWCDSQCRDDWEKANG